MKIRIAVSHLPASPVLALAPLQHVRAEVSKARFAQQFSTGCIFPGIHGVQGD
ncbi:MAG: hypothetical protein HY525_03630 [Betaproteobacteria bacterium]|nr:hypothetical protein [Betaproteobacteria bacterium]